MLRDRRPVGFGLCGLVVPVVVCASRSALSFREPSVDQSDDVKRCHCRLRLRVCGGMIGREVGVEMDVDGEVEGGETREREGVA